MEETLPPDESPPEGALPSVGPDEPSVGGPDEPSVGGPDEPSVGGWRSLLDVGSV